MWDTEGTMGVVRIMKNKIFMMLCLKSGGYWLPFLNAGMSEQTVDRGARYNGSTICSQVYVCCFLPGKVNILTMKCLLSINNMSQYYTHLMPRFSFANSVLSSKLDIGAYSEVNRLKMSRVALFAVAMFRSERDVRNSS